MLRSLPNSVKAYLAISLGLCLYYLLRWPIALGDTDLWYHLRTGLEMWRTLHIPPDTGFFSFITPPRQGVDLWWLFQAVVYLVYRVGGYPGLIVFKAAIFAASWLCLTAMAGRILQRFPWRAALLASFYAAFLAAHFKQMRPQTTSVLCMAACLLVLESGAGWLPALPLLALLWCNLHGIFYPVLFILVGAYGAQYLWEARSRRTMPIRPLSWLALSAACVLATPGLFRLLPVPFTTLSSAMGYIGDLQPLTLGSLFYFRTDGAGLAGQTLFVVIFWSSALAAISSLRHKGARASDLLLWLGGLFLLTRGARFMYYSSILFLPILARGFARPKVWFGLIPLRSQIATVLLLALPLFSIGGAFENRPRYPYSEERLPRGVAAFLNRVNVGGTVLNHPNFGGFLEWTLSPSYRIFMDMRVPALFTDRDFIDIRSALLDRDALAPVLARYKPTFISVPVSDSAFPQMIAHFPDYALVFFDDAEALYVDRAAHPELAKTYGLAALDPFSLSAHSTPVRPGPRGSKLRAELQRLIEIDPYCLTTRQLAAQIALADGDREAARDDARILIEYFPEYPVGYSLLQEAGG